MSFQRSHQLIAYRCVRWQQEKSKKRIFRIQEAELVDDGLR